MWVVGIVVAITGTIVVPVWLASRDDGPDTPEEREASCRSDHDAPKKGVRTDATDLWSDCSWPPVSGADEDGYFEITVRHHPISTASLADEYSGVDVFESSCERIRVLYRFENQGTAVDQEPLDLNMDQIVSGYDGSPEQVPFDLLDEIGGSPLGRLFVLINGRYSVKDAECVEPPEVQP
jgi:hypothetical protein